MKGLSLWQPWAQLVACGAKRIETRSWGTQYRGPLVIHATQAFPSEARALCMGAPFMDTLIMAGYSGTDDLPRGAIVAVANLHRVGAIGRRADGAVIVHGRALPVEGDELAFGDYTPGRARLGADQRGRAQDAGAVQGRTRVVGCAARRAGGARGAGDGAMIASDAVADAGSGARVNGAASVSLDGRYRYTLTRVWDGGDGTVNFIMLNPSTADAEHDDPTIRRCIGFARGWGYHRLVVTNLFALRSTNPQALAAAGKAARGLPRNPAELEREACAAALVVCAWGNHGLDEGRFVAKLFTRWGVSELHHLGLTKAGAPRHPLYVRADTRPQPWEAQ